MSTAPAEVVYFHKKCHHCGQVLDRIEKMSAAWSQCNNEKCPYIVRQALSQNPDPWQECYNRK